MPLICLKIGVKFISNTAKLKESVGAVVQVELFDFGSRVNNYKQEEIGGESGTNHPWISPAVIRAGPVFCNPGGPNVSVALRSGAQIEEEYGGARSRKPGVDY